MALDLKSISHKSQLTNAIVESDKSGALSKQAADSIASTALMLAELQTWSSESAPHSQIYPDQLFILPPTASKQPAQKIRDFLRDLVLSAEKASAAQACSSILAGQSSESDDSGDISFWLGNASGEYSNARQVLDALGLSEWANSGNIVNGKPPAMISTLEIALLNDSYGFRVSSPATGGITVFFYVGRYSDEWVGLLGIGTLQ